MLQNSDSELLTTKGIRTGFIHSLQIKENIKTNGTNAIYS